MADDLPTEFDVVVVGTGMPESILAAALSRIGQRVLHIDRNEYYSGKWASFNFEGINKWIKQVTEGENDLEHPNTDKLPDLQEGQRLVKLCLHDNSYSDVKTNFFVKEEEVSTTSMESKSDDEMQMKLEEKIVTKEGVDDSQQKEIKEDMSQSHEDDGKTVEDDGTLAEDAGKIVDVAGKSVDVAGKPVEDAGKSVEEAGKSVEEDGSMTDTAVKTSEDSNITKKDGGEAPESSKALGTPGISNTLMQAGEKNKEWTSTALKKEWRKFNLDISPKLVYCAGSMVELLISSDIAKYCEFKTVTRMLTVLNDKLEKVPCSRADVFSSKQVSMLEKRMLMKLLTFCGDYEKHPQEYQDFADKPFSEFLKSKKLSENVFHFVQHSIAMATDNMTTLEGLAHTQKFLRSLGRYGNTAFLWSLYGSGELPQSFCRMCAVFGGIYCLRMAASYLVVGSDNQCKSVVLTTGQNVSCKHLIIEESYLSDEFFKDHKKCYVHRGIFITDESVLPSKEQQLSLMTLHDPKDGNRPVTVLELPSSSMASPRGLNVVHLTRKSSDKVISPEEDLQDLVQKLFTTEEGGFEETKKPRILWSMYYKQMYSEALKMNDSTPENVIVLPGPGPELDLDWVVDQTKEIFQKLMPGEEFLPRPPHPDDIIYVDENEAKVGDNTNHSGFGGEGGEENGSHGDTEQNTEEEKLENCDTALEEKSENRKSTSKTDAMEQTDHSDTVKQTDPVESNESCKNES